MSIIPKSLKRKASAMLSKLNNTPKKPGSYTPKHSYLVVSAAYNVEGYLDDFFQSLVDQTIRKISLKIIVVDDGSTDSTAAKVNEWAARYPELIQLLQKENGGQASARNLGIDHLQNDWVCFIDPDDFIAPDYFECADRAFRAHPNAKLATVNTKFFIEDKNEFKNTPMSWCFEKGDTFFAFDSEEILPIFSMASSFFRVDELKRLGLKTSTEIRPNFEDAHFANAFLLGLDEGEVGFLRSPIYYYRKRSDKSSTIDSSYRNPDKIVRVPEKGMLDLCDIAYKARGEVPRNIKFTLLYDIAWLLRRYVSRPENTYQFAKQDTDRALELMRRLIDICGIDALFDARNRNMGFDLKAGCAHYFLKRPAPFQKVYLRRVDTKNHVLVFQSFVEAPKVLVDQHATSPLALKVAEKTLFDQTIFNSFTLLVPYDDEKQELEFSFSNNCPVTIDANGKGFPGPVQISAIVEEFTKKWKEFEPTQDTWIVMDRIISAGNNGEHFLRFLMQNHPEQRCLFALDRNSSDWERLEKDGLPLIAYGSKEFEDELRHCTKIVSSHAESFISSYFPKEYFISKDFIWLQHEICTRDVSNQLNPKRSINMVATATPAERTAFIEDGSPYNLTTQEVRLTGFPYHDVLAQISNSGHGAKISSHNSKPFVLAAPDFDLIHLGGLSENGLCTATEPNATEVAYLEAWLDILSSHYFYRLLGSGIEIILLLPDRLLPACSKREEPVPAHIKLIGQDTLAPITDLIPQCLALLTDYSSLAFDAAFLQKPIVYLQIDDFVDGGVQFAAHSGWFDFEKDGLGPVVRAENELESVLNGLIENKFQSGKLYTERAQRLFPHRNGGCCERIYAEIMHLHERQTI